jgi:hypothetical protein
MGVKNIVKRIGDRAGNRVAKLSELSSGQVERVQEEREKYLLEMPSPNDQNAIKITEKMMAASSIEIFNAYLSQIKDLYIPVEKDAEYGEEFDPRHNIRYFNITKWVTDTKENNLEKLVNVYAVLADEDCNIALVFNRKKAGTDVYLAVVNTNNDTNNVNADIYKSRLIEAIKGNFPGADWDKDADDKGIIPFLDNDKPYSVATASNIPTEKSEKFISQTIEKLLDGIVPESRKTEYTIVLLATPIKDVEERKLKLGEFYSGLTPYASWSTNFQFDDMQTFGSSATVGVNVGVSAGIQNGQNSTITDTEGTTDSSSRTDTQSGSKTDTAGTSAAESESNAHSDGTNESTTETDGTNWSKANGSTSTLGTSSTEGTSSSDSLGGGVTVGSSQTAGVTVGNAFAGSVNASVSTNQSVSANYNHTWGHNSSETVSNSLAKSLTKTEGGSSSVAKALGKTASDTLTKGLTNTVSNSIAKTTGNSVANTLGKAVTKSMAKASGVSKAVNYGANMGANFARSSTVTAIVGKHQGITQNFSNFNIKHALELLEAQMKRLEQSTALGMWDFAAYVLSEDQNIANNVAHTYLALTLGEDSYMSKSAVNLWRGSVEEEKGQARTICSYIRELRHPIFALSPDAVAEDAEYNVYPPIVTATTSLSGKELAYSLNFPQKAVAGLPILECAEFGRNVVTYDITEKPTSNIRLGNVFHMNHKESTPIELSLDSFRSHTFITGSTGSGKSNTVYQLLEKICLPEDLERSNKVHFLVVEPAKGEYKNVFGNDSNVSVYGTNPLVAPLLRIDPFSFPNDVHVLEHMDRLIEIFNVCWPMYAAMPAVLKSAVEKSYVDCGWDLITSKNKYDRNFYPDFKTVADNIKTIIDSSEYDNENKGAYKGSLLTRLQSLTNGINGLIFASDELSGEELFDRNVIIDLSRVGSSETKSLIMGLLVLKLQEYRSTSGLPMNSELNHITVLEEAHNLLRRTSTQQSTEGANLLGKSVEMIANAIAEMRTYGEGFIIADQAPGLMDMSVIRNTNTKIIMRLPDQSDRELVGRAADLNDDQIKELAKLPCGVGAVYQNEWVQPVLCKIDEVDTKNAEYRFDSTSNGSLLNQNDEVKNSLLNCIMDKELFSIGDKQDLKELKSIVLKSGLSSLVKVDLFNYIESEKEEGMLALQRLIYDFLDAEKAISESVEHSEIHEWVDAVLDKLEPSVKGYTKKQIDIAVMLILCEQMVRDPSYKNVLNKFIETYRNGGGVF